MFGVGLAETVLIVLFLLILFGANRLPDIGRSLGDAKRESRQTRLTEEWEDVPEDLDAEDKP